MSQQEEQRQSQIAQTVPQHFRYDSRNDEIDVKELFLALWQGKWTIIVMTILFAVGATIYALSQPNIYESKATIVIEPNPYGYDFGENILVDHHQQTVSMFDSALIFSKKNRHIAVSKQAKDIESAYDSVKNFTETVNSVYKAIEIEKLEVILASLEPLIRDEENAKAKEILSEKYAEQQYKLAVLNNVNSKLVHVILPPTKAINHIKPKRTLIVVLGVFLGGLLGVVLVFFRMMFGLEPLRFLLNKQGNSKI